MKKKDMPGGTYTNDSKDVLMCACSRSQRYILRRTVHEADPDAFVMMTETSEVFAKGLKKSGKGAAENSVRENQYRLSFL